MDAKFLVYVATMICHLFETINGKNILVVMPATARSHFKSVQPLLEEIVKRGHNVTLVSGYKLDDVLQSRVTFVDLKPHFHHMKIIFAEMRKQSRLENIIFSSNAVQDYAEEILKQPEIQGLIHSKDLYDLVIVEMFYFDAFFAFGHKFNAPVVAYSPQTIIPFYNWILGSPFPSSYVPNMFLAMTEKMSFFARVINTGLNIFCILFYEFVSLARSQAQIEKYFNFDEISTPHIKDIMRNISVTFVNAHNSFGYPKPEWPNIVHIAGLHLIPQKPLPANIQKFMDDAEYGVVYLSLGSLIEPSNIESVGKLFTRTLKNLPQRVIMKWDPKLLPHIPNNFLVQEWVSQIDILNHPKCRLFITHGGLHSLLESINASVPLVGIPFFTDQQYNMAMVEYYDIGTTLRIKDISTGLLEKVKEILKNPKYKQNIEKKSRIFRQRLTSPLDTAIFWVDHVLEHKNTAHLKSASYKLKWYELYSLDIMAVYAAFVFIIAYLMMFITTKIVQKFNSTKVKMEYSKTKSWKNEKVINNLKYD